MKGPVLVQEISGTRTFRAGSFTFTVAPESCTVRVTSWDWKELNGECAWWHHGCKTIWHFIAGTAGDPQYVMSKFVYYSSLLEVDPEETRKNMLRVAEEIGLTVEQQWEVEDHLKGCSTEDDYSRVPHIENAYEDVRHREKRCCEEFRASWAAFCAFIKTQVIPNLEKEPA